MPVFLKFSATCDGSPKRVSIIDQTEDAIADPSHSLIPGQAFHVHQLTGAEYIKLMGKF